MLILKLQLVTRQLKPNIYFETKSSKLELSRLFTFHKSDGIYSKRIIVLIQDILPHAIVKATIQEKTYNPGIVPII